MVANKGILKISRFDGAMNVILLNYKEISGEKGSEKDIK